MKSNDAPVLVVKTTPGITSEQASDARALALRFVLDCYAKKKAAHPGGPDDAEESKNDRTATASIQED